MESQSSIGDQSMPAVSHRRMSRRNGLRNGHAIREKMSLSCVRMLYAPRFRKRNDDCDAKKTIHERTTQMRTSHWMTPRTMKTTFRTGSRAMRVARIAQPLGPKMARPTRTIVEPSSMAAS